MLIVTPSKTDKAAGTNLNDSPIYLVSCQQIINVTHGWSQKLGHGLPQSKVPHHSRPSEVSEVFALLRGAGRS